MSNIDLNEILKKIKQENSKNFPDAEDNIISGLESRDEIHNRGLKDFYKIRTIWSNWIIRFVSVLIFHQIGISIWILCKDNSIHNQGLLYLILGENFTQVLALAFIVVKFLFPKSQNEE